MKRMVTEEEIAEIASQNSKPLYRYNGIFSISVNIKEADCNVVIFYDFVSGDAGKALENDDYVEALKEAVRLVFGGIYFAGCARYYNIQNNDDLIAQIFTSRAYGSRFSATLLTNGDAVNLAPNGTYDEFEAYFLDSEAFSICRTNLQTGETYFREM